MPNISAFALGTSQTPLPNLLPSGKEKPAVTTQRVVHKSSSCSELEGIMQLRHDNPCIMQFAGKYLHGLLFAMYQISRFRFAGA